MTRGSIPRSADIGGMRGMGGRVHSEETIPEGLATALAVAAAVTAQRPGTLERRQRLVRAVSRHFDLVWRSLRRFGVPERLADDAAQDVFMTLSDRLEAVSEEHERSFLIAVAVRIAANARRKLERSREVPSDQLDNTATQHTPEDLLDYKQRLEELDRLLEALPFEQRTVFVLYELEGHSLPEIAEALEIPLGTATSRLRRARLKFESWVVSREPAGGEL